jgi:antitoxin ChpS
MMTVNIRKQGGAAVMTIPADVLKILNIEVGAKLVLDVAKDGFTAKPVVSQHLRKRYALHELLRGITSTQAQRLNEEINGTREGGSVGRECL